MRGMWMKPPALAASLLAGAVIFAAPAAAATYGLTIGINDYIGLSNDLRGAVNDAEDIANALRGAGASEVMLLTDAAATKAAIEDAWLHLVNVAVSGDTIVFSYAGHGGQEPEPAGRRGEDDGLNETFLLAGYQSIGPASSERIVDDEIFSWLQLAEDRGIEVIFVADSCFSGTMYRAIAGPPLTYRVGDFDPPAAPDPATLPDERFATMDETHFQHVTFIGATQEDKLDPELIIDGVPRGALSWAFARAIEGAADENGDASLTQHELLSYLVPTVEIKAQNQQTPSILPLSPVAKTLISLAHVAPAAPPAPPEMLVTIAVRGDAPIPVMDGVAETDDETAADLIWNPSAGWVEHRIGGRVAENIGPDEIGGVVAKWAALAFIDQLATREPFAMTLPGGNQTHFPGEVVTVAMSGGTKPYLTLFNLPPNGRVELLYPLNPAEAAEDWTNRSEELQLRVDRPPFGAEHLVAILTDEPPVALQAALGDMASHADSTGLAAMLMSLFASGDVQAGVLGIYTAAD
jgi:hypothetical protein